MNPKGVRATQAHLDRIEGMSRDQALLVGDWLDANSKEDEVEGATLGEQMKT